MTDLKIELNDAEIVRILQSDGVMADLMRRAHQIANAAGEGKYDVTPSHSPTRARVSVGTGDYKARKGEATNRSLTRALDAGRG